MIEIIFLITLALIWIIFAMIQDLRNKEIANWLNFSLIIFAFGFRFFYSLFLANNFNFFYQGIIGLGIFFVLGNALYYGKMFAGGDAKLIIALGVILPFSEGFITNVQSFVLFFIIFLSIGAFYGLFISFFLSLKNFKNMKKEFIRYVKKYKKIISCVMVGGLFLMILGFVESLFFWIGVLAFIYPYLYIYAKAVDKACMIKGIKSRNLREGDWLYKNLKIGNKVIRAKWEGLSEKEIKLIQRKYKKVLIRNGIAFSPVFLISFIIFVALYFLRINLWDSFW
ncbi:hypothetical protein DRN69_04105 [Candidatus Pacearchaeota archaeon]|nr:MAG: hypothetical protein DRN69_04105 [Candidatus Pacearchaeota archaeon]